MSGAGGGVRVQKDLLTARLRDAGFGFKRQGKRVGIWKRKGSTDRVDVPRRSWFTESQARHVLTQAGLSSAEINDFLGTIAQHR